jgi:AraC family ethanolamine operon transcriptional activator
MPQHQKSAKKEKKLAASSKHFVQRALFYDFDDFTENIRGWNNEFRQLDKGKFWGELLQIFSDSVLITFGSMNRRLEMHGVSPKNMKMFGIPLETDLPIVWRGKALENSSIQSYGVYTEFEAVTPPGFTTYTISISEALISQFCREHNLPELEKKLNEPAPFIVNPDNLQELQWKIHAITQALAINPLSLNNAGLRTEIESELPVMLLKALSSTNPKAHRPSLKRREIALKRARGYIAEFGNELLEPITVGDLCKITGVSERTLEYAFRERFGIPPKTYLQAHRLNAARKELRNSDPLSSTTISDVANRWGFWHMGQFAADYRKLFGELPSETLG